MRRGGVANAAESLLSIFRKTDLGRQRSVYLGQVASGGRASRDEAPSAGVWERRPERLRGV
ncbi:hypothetical protein QJS66_14185 [Kocuria rhizophila]|nr:hypothetical protein QJS66_14185 [Kocuria rhizophila]